MCVCVAESTRSFPSIDVVPGSAHLIHFLNLLIQLDTTPTNRAPCRRTDATPTHTHTHTHTHTAYVPSHTPDTHTPAVCHWPVSQVCLFFPGALIRDTSAPVNPSRITASAVCCFIYTWNIDVLNLTPRVLKCPFLPCEDREAFSREPAVSSADKNTLSVLGLVERACLVSTHWLVGSKNLPVFLAGLSCVCVCVCVCGGPPVLCVCAPVLVFLGFICSCTLCAFQSASEVMCVEQILKSSLLWANISGFHSNSVFSRKENRKQNSPLCLNTDQISILQYRTQLQRGTVQFLENKFKPIILKINEVIIQN